MVSLKHEFQSGKADGTDVTLVKPTNWNAEHKFETAADGVVLGRAAGASPGAVQELPITSLFFPAMIVPYAGSVAPDGWLLCQGQLLVRADYPALSTAIGGTYNIGGETAAQFRVPDLRGRVPAGVDYGSGWLPGWVLGTRGGASSHTLTAHELAAHSHGDSGHGHGQGLHAHSSDLNGTGMAFVTQTSGQAFWQWTGGAGGPNALYASGVTAGNYADIHTGYANIGNTGGNGAHNNVQPTIALNYLIKT